MKSLIITILAFILLFHLSLSAEESSSDDGLGYERSKPVISDSALGHDSPDLPSAAELAETGPAVYHNPSERAQRYIRAARMAAKSNDYERAEMLYSQPVQLDIPEELKQTALLELAAMYENSDSLTKMALVLEKFVRKWPADPRVPHIYMRLGHLYRDLGSYNVAISRFYKVLSVSLNVTEDRLSDYKSLSMRAQYDIAETYFSKGDYEEAAKFYGRLTLLDLPYTDQEHVLFKTSYIEHLNQNYPAAIHRLKQFLKNHVDSPLVPESRFLLANAYKEMKKNDLALQTALVLLQDQAKRTEGDLRTWRYWQKKTANLVANDFYERGDYRAALKIYQAMIQLSSTAQWQMPVLYQMGLCFERLRLLPRAQEAYRILSELEGWEEASIEGNDSLLAIRDMAEWRYEHLNWTEHISGDLLQIQRNTIEQMEDPDKLPSQLKKEREEAEAEAAAND